MSILIKFLKDRKLDYNTAALKENSNRFNSYNISLSIARHVSTFLSNVISLDDKSMLSIVLSTIDDDINNYCDEFIRDNLSELDVLVRTSSDTKMAREYKNITQLMLKLDDDFKNNGKLHQAVIKELKEIVITSFKNDDDAPVTCNDEFFGQIIKSLGVTPYDVASCTFISGFYDVTDLNPSLIDKNCLSIRDTAYYLSLGAYLSTKADNPNAFYLQDNVPDELAANPIVNALRRINCDEQGITAPYLYDERRLKIIRKEYAERAHIICAIEEFAAYALGDQVATGKTPSNDFFKLLDQAADFELKNFSAENILEGETDRKFSNDYLKILIRCQLLNVTEDQESVPIDKRIEILIKKILLIRSAFDRLDENASQVIQKNGLNNYVIPYALEIMNSLTYTSDLSSRELRLISIAIDDMPLPSISKLLCYAFGELTLSNADADKTVAKSLFDMIGTVMPTTSWEFMAREKLLNRDALSSLIKLNRYNEGHVYGIAALRFDMLSDFIVACEDLHPGIAKLGFEIAPNLHAFNDEFEMLLLKKLNAQKSLTVENTGHECTEFMTDDPRL